MPGVAGVPAVASKSGACWLLCHWPPVYIETQAHHGLLSPPATTAWPKPFLSTGFLYCCAHRQIEKADPEGHRAAAVFRRMLCCFQRNGGLRTSWRKWHISQTSRVREVGQGQCMWPDRSEGRHSQLELVLRSLGGTFSRDTAWLAQWPWNATLWEEGRWVNWERLGQGA